MDRHEELPSDFEYLVEDLKFLFHFLDRLEIECNGEESTEVGITHNYLSTTIYQIG